MVFDESLEIGGVRTPQINSSRIIKDLYNYVLLCQKEGLLDYKWLCRVFYKQYKDSDSTEADFLRHICHSNFKYIEKTQVWAEITTELPELDEIIKKALSKMQTKQIRTEGLLLEINVSGTEDESLVNRLISGGSKALKLIDLFKNSEYMEKEEE